MINYSPDIDTAGWGSSTGEERSGQTPPWCTAPARWRFTPEVAWNRRRLESMICKIQQTQGMWYYKDSDSICTCTQDTGHSRWSFGAAWKLYIDFQAAPNFGPILDDRLKEKILKPWKGAHSCHSTCLCVRPSVNNLHDTPFDLGT